MNAKSDRALITGFNGRIGPALVKRLRDGLDNIVSDALRENKLFWSPFWNGDAMKSGPSKVTFAGGKCYVF